MAIVRAQIFDGAIAHLMTAGTTWTDGTIKARFINDQAFSASATVASYTLVMDANMTLATKAINNDLTNNFTALDCDDFVGTTTGGTDTDAVIIYRSAATDVPLFYLTCTNAAIGAGNTATIVCPATGLFQFAGSVPAMMKSWLQGAIDITALPSTLSIFTVAAQPTAATINSLTATSNVITTNFELSDTKTAWTGGNFQRFIKLPSSFGLTVAAGLMHGVVIGDPTGNLMYAYIPLLRSLASATKIKFNVPSNGVLCIGGV